MLTHLQIWTAIDALAAREGGSVSSLAKKAGLDATTFNKSKRMNSDNQPRWPSTESIAKILAATGVEIDDFLRLTRMNAAWPSRSVPLLSLNSVRLEHFDAKGTPQGAAWESIAFPQIEGEALYALEISDNAYLPIYREGTHLILGRAAPLRRGDRIAVHHSDGRLDLAVFGRQTDSGLTMTPLQGGVEEIVPRDALFSVARILWASQ
jgi:phage repressor protein C with HTH and peptisase S24 domain